jgi:NADPH:quinone reductase-like Zn-dependent oxidoreductase
MKAGRIHAYGGPEQLVYEDSPQPHTVKNQVLIRVYAAGVTPTELSWSTTWKTKTGADRPLPVIPGHELSGVVSEVGPGVDDDLSVGSEVYGLTDFTRDGTAAEYTIAQPTEITFKPNSIDHVHAAAAPMDALTAWQALFDHAHLTSGQRILIHGAAGGIGTYAVQLARWAGAFVIGTASTKNMDFLSELRVDSIIDYTAVRFDDAVNNVDIVLDTVGGETLRRSVRVLRPGGRLISVVEEPSLEALKEASERGIIPPTFFIVEPNRNQLTQIGNLIDAGHITPIVDSVFSLSNVREAYEGGKGTHTHGKMVLKIAD